METTRDKIQAAQIINRLYKCVTGEIEMTAQQVAAAKTLLGKVLPDLQATQLTAETTVNYVARMPAPAEDADEWQKRYSPTLQ